MTLEAQKKATPLELLYCADEGVEPPRLAALDPKSSMSLPFHHIRSKMDCKYIVFSQFHLKNIYSV